MRLHQSNQGYSMACLALLICKYHVPYCIPCCNLQSMIMYVKYFFFIHRFYVNGNNEKKM
jgi:hypothetical protein